MFIVCLREVSIFLVSECVVSRLLLLITDGPTVFLRKARSALLSGLSVSLLLGTYLSVFSPLRYFPVLLN